MLLIDASVWVAAVIPRHPQQGESRKLLERGGPAAVLDLTLYEVANVVAGNYRQPREARKLVQAVLRACETPPLRVDQSLLEHAVDLTTELGLTAYDAAYVAVARQNGWQLVSLDIADLVSKGLAVAPDAADYP